MDSVFFILVENDIKVAGNAELVESADADTVLGFELEEDKV